MPNIEKALSKLRSDKNNSVSQIYESAKFGNGTINDMTFTIKDVFATKDAKTQSSSKILKDFMPNYDATVIKKIRDHGGAILAKVHGDELALGGTGMFSAFGPIANPLDKSLLVGGSSSGSAATFNETISCALGSDTGDSIRYPASNVGAVGFKPSYGAVSRHGLFPYAPSLDTVAWMTHNVKDTIRMANLLYGEDENDMTTRPVDIEKNIKEAKPKKIAILNTHGEEEDYISNAMSKLIERLKQQDIETTMVTIPNELLNAIDPTYEVISYSEAASTDSNLNGISFGNRESGKNWEEIMTNTRSKNFGKMVQRRFTLGSLFLDKDNQDLYFRQAQKVRRLIRDKFAEIYSKFDTLIYPAVPHVAPKISVGKKDSWLSNVLICANFSGSPSITLNLGSHNNLPFSVAMDAKLYEDKKLLSHALYIEKIIGELNE